ncbi:MAG: MarR family transcriptional regulator [Chloroflexi bacterium]|nr:MAG: MarR family transcriptional regulator [Chloroflexota bacterium]
MSTPAIEEAIAGYKKTHRALLTSKGNRWRDLDISMQQLRALYLLREEEEASVGRLAELFGMGLPGTSLLADRLVRSGYVERRTDPTDRRRVLLSLTRAGDRLVGDLREGSSSQLRRWMAQLSPEDLAALSRGWRALAEVASRHAQVLEGSAV